MAVSVLEPKGHQISYIKPLLIIILWGTVTARQTCTRSATALTTVLAVHSRSPG